MNVDAQPPCPICREASQAEAELGGYAVFSCPGCGLRFAPGAFDAEVDYERIYDSPEYRAEQVMGQAGRAEELGRHPTYRPFFRRLTPWPGATLLDVGCGVGRFCAAAQRAGWDVMGIDVSERAIRASCCGSELVLQQARLEDMAGAGRVFDVITAFEVLEHLSDPLSFLGLVHRALKPGGQFFGTVPNWDCSEVREARRPDWLPPVHLCFFTETALRGAVVRAGFRVRATGIIRPDPAPEAAGALARWMARRALRRPNPALGLWVHALRPEGA